MHTDKNTLIIRMGCISIIFFIFLNYLMMPVPMAARSKAQVYGHSPAEIVGSNSTGGVNVCVL
jgi:uncharacterized membrane protein